MEAATVIGWLFMAVSGILISMQSGVNLTLGKHIGKSFAAVVSFCTGLCALLVFFGIDHGAVKSLGPTKAGAQGMFCAAVRCFCWVGW